MRVFYSDHHQVELPAGHRFPMGKYARLRERLLAERILPPEVLQPAPPIEPAVVATIHDPGYVEAVLAGTLDAQAQRRLGFPWSPALVTRTLASVSGTLLAARAALGEPGDPDEPSSAAGSAAAGVADVTRVVGIAGVAGNLAGGTHHAHRDFGSGYCVFNDIAVAAHALLSEGRVERVLVFDADVHQGDGTAALFADEPRVFTCSIHGAKNFPFRKRQSDLDIALADGADDAAYLAAIEQALLQCLGRVVPDLMFYQAGVDALAEDKLGRLAVTAAGLAARDRLVLCTARARGIPIVLTLGGGYADPLEATIAAHAGTYRAAVEVFGATG